MIKQSITLIAALFALLALPSCATKHEDRVEHHHHPEVAYEGKCAYSVANKKYDVPGNPDYQLVHRGITYYFSSEELMKQFKDHADDYVRRGKLNWMY